MWTFQQQYSKTSLQFWDIYKECKTQDIEIEVSLVVVLGTVAVA